MLCFTSLPYNSIADLPCMDGGGCSHICAVVNGEAQCFCPIGFKLEEPENVQCVGKNNYSHNKLIVEW